MTSLQITYLFFIPLILIPWIISFRFLLKQWKVFLWFLLIANVILGLPTVYFVNKFSLWQYNIEATSGIIFAGMRFDEIIFGIFSSLFLVSWCLLFIKIFNKKSINSL